MTTWRVGEAGATVFNADGTEATRLRPGQVVVPGLTDVPGSLAAQHQIQAKRLHGYADKRLRPAEDKRMLDEYGRVLHRGDPEASS